MKKKTGIWIDTTKAILVELEAGKEKLTQIEGNIDNKVHHEGEGDMGSFSGLKHLNNESKFSEKKDHQIGAYLNNVLDALKLSDEIFVFGPAEMKIKLKALIVEDKQLASKLRAVETADSMTDNQVAAKVREFFA